jgi:hypothetical protein
MTVQRHRDDLKIHKILLRAPLAAGPHPLELFPERAMVIGWDCSNAAIPSRKRQASKG